MDRPVAWGAATLAAPTAPLAALLSLLALGAVTERGTAFLWSPVPVLLLAAGVAVLAPPRARRVRGTAVGLAAGAATLVPLVLLASARPWLS